MNLTTWPVNCRDKGRFFKTIVILWTLVCLIGCTSTKQSSMTPQQRREADQRSTVRQGTTIGAIAGGLGGLVLATGAVVLVAALTGDSKKAARIGAVLIPAATLAGGVIGAKKGQEWGKRVARKKADYANTEEYLLANLADARALRVKAQAETARLGKRMQELTLQTNQYRQGRASRNQIAKHNAAIASEQTEVRQRIQRLNEEIIGQQAVVKDTAQNSKNAQALRAIEAEVSELKKVKQEMLQYSNQLTEISAQSGV
ncbi:MAG: hypothetical protein M0Q93_01910 [Terrimicrobiaceae bacterium]|nr:hypothetical protein [Terrimicrobiaceae bacterium]